MKNKANKSLKNNTSVTLKTTLQLLYFSFTYYTVNFSTFFEYTKHEKTRGHPLKLNKNRVRTDLRRICG